MGKVYCSHCGRTVRKDYTWTDFFRASCPVQFLRTDIKICFNCLPKEVATHVYYRLINPIKGCDDCEGTENCASSTVAENARKMNSGIRMKEQCGPQDLRDDWPSAIPGPG